MKTKKVIAKKVNLPDTLTMQKLYNTMKLKQSLEFNYDYKRVEGIIDPYDYMNNIAGKINAIPSLFHLLSKPVLLYYIIFHSWSHFFYRLNDSDIIKQELAKEQIFNLDKNETSKYINMISYMLFLLILCLSIFFLYLCNVKCHQSLC